MPLHEMSQHTQPLRNSISRPRPPMSGAAAPMSLDSFTEFLMDWRPRPPSPGTAAPVSLDTLGRSDGSFLLMASY